MIKKLMALGAATLLLSGCATSTEKTYTPEQAVVSYFYFGCDRDNFEEMVFDTNQWSVKSQDDKSYTLTHSVLYNWEMKVTYSNSGALVQPTSDVQKSLRANNGCPTDEISDQTIEAGIAEGSIN